MEDRWKWEKVVGGQQAGAGRQEEGEGPTTSQTGGVCRAPVLAVGWPVREGEGCALCWQTSSVILVRHEGLEEVGGQVWSPH